MKTHLQAEADDPLAAFDGTHDTVVDFLRRRLPMTLAINTVIALLIALLLHSWDEVIPNLVIAYCIGLSILALVALVRCTVMQRFRGSLHLRFGIYFVLIVAGATGGELLSKLFLPHQSPTYTMHEGYIWLVCIVFSLVAGSIAIFINFSWVRLAQSKRDVERAERAAIEAQLRALQAQIEPHFLFNTLANLDALIATDAGCARIATERAIGRRVTIDGIVRDGAGAVVPDALVEIWQANAAGRYAHPDDKQAKPLDPNFTGYGRAPTDDDGRFAIETVMPGRVPGPGDTLQAPHLLLSILARGILTRLVTRVYFDDEPSTADDAILQLVPAERRASLIARRTADAAYTFDLTLQGEGETVFFDV